MTQHEERQGAAAGQKAAEFAAEGRQRLEDFTGAQAQLWDRLQDSNRKWLDRIQIEANLTADLATKLSASKSLTDTANLFQNWTVRHFELATDDARRLLTDTQEILAAGARFWSQIGENGRRRGH
jgi:hypothetical protein